MLLVKVVVFADWIFGLRLADKNVGSQAAVREGRRREAFGVSHCFAKRSQWARAVPYKRHKPTAVEEAEEGTCLRGPRGRSGGLSDQNGF
jgi:hypothetical protein